MILGLIILVSFAFITNQNNASVRKFKITQVWPMRMKERADYFPYFILITSLLTRTICFMNSHKMANLTTQYQMKVLIFK